MIHDYLIPIIYMTLVLYICIRNILSKQIELEKLKHKNEISKNIKCNYKPLFKYVKSKTKIHKNINTLKNDKTIVETPGAPATCFQSVHSLEEFGLQQKSCYEEGTKIIDEQIIRAKDIKL